MTLKQGLKHIMDNYLIAVDIETTGLNTDTDNIIEIAAIKFLNGEYVDKYVSYVNPMRKITEEITALTGITDNDVIFSPTISQIVEEVNQFIGNSPVVGHNLKFDLSILNREKIAINNDYIDTYGNEVDIMVEAKHKELAVIKYKEIHYNEEEAVLGHA